MLQKIFRDFLVVIGFVLEAFGCGAGAEIETSGKSGVPREMRIVDPQRVLTHRRSVSALQPCAVLVTLRLLRFVDTENHRSEKRRLRAAEVVGAVAIQDRAVVFDFEKEILDHATREFDFSGTQQSAKDEVTVPSVHFIETST